MSNISLIIEERAASIGSFLVGRLLPFRQKRMVGPFAFIDHMGPASLSETENFDVPPHPHIGLSTLTYLFEGTIMHRDSLGTEKIIEPGAVNWMTAGKGITHSERTPDNLRHSKKTLHGLQIWVALPVELEAVEPSFYHIEADKLPTWIDNGVHFKLIAGQAFGHQSPVPVYSPMYMIEIIATEDAILSIGEWLYGDSAMYILEGSVESEGYNYGSRQILIAADTQMCTFNIKSGSTVYLFGGESFPEERYIYWNFVNSSKAVIDKAKQDWIDQKFPTVPGEIDFVPLPDKLF